MVGTIGKTRLTLFTLSAPASKLSLDARNGSASLRGASVTLTRRAGKAIKRALKLRTRPGGRFGTAVVEALVKGTGGGDGGGWPAARRRLAVAAGARPGRARSPRSRPCSPGRRPRSTSAG